MKLLHAILAATLPLLLAACAAEPAGPAATPATASSSGKDEMICSREYPTGSNIPITKCRTREQIEAEKAAAVEGMRRSQTGGPGAKRGDGG
jgi:hypothetical protein